MQLLLYKELWGFWGFWGVGLGVLGFKGFGVDSQTSVWGKVQRELHGMTPR